MYNPDISAIFTRFKEHNPNPQCELYYNSTFQLLIAVILSAQSTDARVNIITKELFKVAPTAQDFVSLGLEAIKIYIASIGLANTKAKNIFSTCNILVEKYQGKVPENREALENLPGVGRKTANVVLNTAFKDAVIAVDTHVLRVSNRLGFVKTENPLVVEQALYKIVPKEFLKDAHHWLVLHGRYICKAKAPLCNDCFLKDLCYFYKHKNSC